MKLVVVGGHTRNIGKTSAAAGIIAATIELRWTALKITQYGHGVCSTSGDACHCAVEDPEHPFAITREKDPHGGSDTSRMLRAGAAEAYWVRARVGELGLAMPALRRLLEGREHVLMESNSILRFLRPDVYLPVLQFDAEDFKISSRLYLNRADAFLAAASRASEPRWAGIDPRILQGRPVFAVKPPSYCTGEVVSFVLARLGVSLCKAGLSSFPHSLRY